MTAQPGDRLPSTTFKTLGPDGIQDVSSGGLFNGNKVLAIGVIGAFTPVCTRRHLPEFIPYQRELRDAGLVDEVVCISVADPFALAAWGRELGIGEEIRMLTDTNAEFAESLDLAVDLSGMGLGRRSTRYVLFAKDGVIDILKVEKKPGDLEVTSADAIKAAMVTG